MANTIKPRAYIRRKDNHRITAVVIVLLANDRMVVCGPFREMTEAVADWEVC